VFITQFIDLRKQKQQMKNMDKHFFFVSLNLLFV